MSCTSSPSFCPLTEPCSSVVTALWPGGEQAMQKFARLKRPMYITETGIPDAKDRIRAEWAEAYFRAVRSLAQAALPSAHMMSQRDTTPPDAPT